jgi:hypothetical protein
MRHTPRPKDKCYVMGFSHEQARSKEFLPLLTDMSGCGAG